MIIFYKSNKSYFVVQNEGYISDESLRKLSWVLGDAVKLDDLIIEGFFIGPRKEMITPWSTNAVEITQNMGVHGITRIEKFKSVDSPAEIYDPMLQVFYKDLSQDIYTIDKLPDPIIQVHNIELFNKNNGLALSENEIKYLEDLSHKLKRKLTDSEVFGFSQVNSEHCRHKIFNGTFIIDGEKMPDSLFGLIKKTSKVNKNRLVSAYKDNCAFIRGPRIEQFAPCTQDKPDYFCITDIDTVISLKAETHNFPTTVEPFNGAATGSGGEIRDRMAGGKGSIPMAGTAVYMTSYPRLEATRTWEQQSKPRKWLYQTPEEILIKASNGASDFGNKFGQPLICGSLLTFEYNGSSKMFGYDKVIMLAGGIGFGKMKDSHKDVPEIGDKIIVMGGDNYRIGMGGGAVSSVATGEFDNTIELNAVQRSNPEMQKRVANAIRALTEATTNPIVSIHDHGAGGHLNCLSELVEETGGVIELSKLPVGDPTLSAKEIIGNESQERMGLVLKSDDVELLRKIAERERAPMYVVGEITGDMKFTVVGSDDQQNPLDLNLEHMFGSPPATILNDRVIRHVLGKLKYDKNHLQKYIEDVLQIEAVACKDWLTNKVDRSVTGKVALQQTAGPIQLPVNNLGVVAMDYHGVKGIATSIGHAPVTGLINPENGSVLSVAEALTNIIWTPLQDGLRGVSLSANWMWPAKNEGEDARLYSAVKAISEFAIGLGINIPTGKDSLSMTQKYPDGNTVYAPGTVIVSAVGEVTDIRKVVKPVLHDDKESHLIYINLAGGDYHLGGSSFAQITGTLASETPEVKDTEYFAGTFDMIQHLIADDLILAGHDISAGGMITALLEMTFTRNDIGLEVNLSDIPERDIFKLLFSENPGIIIQVKDLRKVTNLFDGGKINYHIIGKPISGHLLNLTHNQDEFSFDIASLRDFWFKTSYLFDRKQCGEQLALSRYKNYKEQPLWFRFPKVFTGKASQYDIELSRRKKTGVKAAIIREKGVNGDREMAWSLHLAGFDVKDVHMTDLISGRETLEEIHFIVFVGGFSNSDVLGSAKGWSGAFLFNEKAKIAVDNFYKRNDTLTLGICNGCQLMVELGLIGNDQQKRTMMLHNDSGKFESSFINVDIQENKSIMMHTLAGSRLGIWVAHGEGKFDLPEAENRYHIPVKYAYQEYPGNPNGSSYAAAALCSSDGRHLAMMPHLERAIFPWQWAYYQGGRSKDEVTPWIEAFVNAREWIITKK